MTNEDQRQDPVTPVAEARLADENGTVHEPHFTGMSLDCTCGWFIGAEDAASDGTAEFAAHIADMGASTDRRLRGDLVAVFLREGMPSRDAERATENTLAFARQQIADIKRKHAPIVHIADRTADDPRPVCWSEYAGHDGPCAASDRYDFRDDGAPDAHR